MLLLPTKLIKKISMKELKKLLLTCIVYFIPVVLFGEILTEINDTHLSSNNFIYGIVQEKKINSEKVDSCKKIIFKVPKILGYLQTGWNYTANDKTKTSSFQAKRLRLLMDGKVGDNIDFRLQIEAFNGISGTQNGNNQKSIHLMDAFATWKIVPEFKVRLGQFYTPLGYENYDISPSTLESIDFSNIVYRMACRNPYEYNFVDYGRDLGIMFIGDIGKSKQGYSYLHYDFAITNGSLPCTDDKNMSKDIYVSTTIQPMKNLKVKATYNYGEYVSNTVKGGEGVKVKDGSRYNPINRFVAGVWYNDPNGLDLRTEIGFVNSKIDNFTFVNEESAYILAAYHFHKFLPLLRWDMYKDNINKTTAAANYNRILLGVTYKLMENAKIQLNWGHFIYPKNIEELNGYKTSEQIQIMGLFSF